MFYRLLVVGGLLASLAQAQGDYLGPSIMTRGAAGVGTRGGETVDLRFFANLNAVYDSGLVPISVGPTGQLTDPGGLYGVEAQIGAYGTHAWKTATLGLDYRGSFRHYDQQSYFDGSDQQLKLGYSYQKSRRLLLDFQGLAATYSQGFAGISTITGTEFVGGVNPNTGILFDNRSSFLQGGMDATYIMSARNSFTVGGEGYDILRQSKALIGMHGYELRGTFEHKLSKFSSLGFLYTHYHYDFPRAFGEATSDGFQVGYSTNFGGKRWVFRGMAGGLQSEVEGLQTVALDPAIANILGISSTVQTFYRKTISPSINASLTRRFKSSGLTFDYNRGISPGNGVYLTSRQESGDASYTYTGVRKTSLTVGGTYNSYSSLGQTITPYHYFSGNLGASYAMTHSLQLTARFESRHQEIDQSVFKKDSYRVTLGIAFSPGDIPLSIW